MFYIAIIIIIFLPASILLCLTLNKEDYKKLSYFSIIYC